MFYTWKTHELNGHLHLKFYILLYNFSPLIQKANATTLFVLSKDTNLCSTTKYVPIKESGSRFDAPHGISVPVQGVFQNKWMKAVGECA